MATFYNQATLTYNNNVTNSNIVTGEFVEALCARKTAVINTYGAGDTITYVISIVNTGTAPFTDITVTDNLGAYEFNSMTLVPLTYVPHSVKYFVNGEPTKAPKVHCSDDSLVFSCVNVPAGGNVLLVYIVELNEYAPLNRDGKINNEVTVTGDCIATPITACETVCTANEPVLSINKSICPSSVTENGRLTYTFLIQNTGNKPARADDNIVVTDEFSPVLNSICVTYDGDTLKEGEDYTYNQQTGMFETVAGRLTVPAAKYKQEHSTGKWIVTPGAGTLVVTGTV